MTTLVDAIGWLAERPSCGWKKIFFTAALDALWKSEVGFLQLPLILVRRQLNISRALAKRWRLEQVTLYAM